MKKLIIAGALLASSSIAFASSCPVEMKAIDAKLPAAKLSPADMSKVKDLRAKGEQFHKEGKHADSMKALGEAKKMLGI